MYLYVDIEHEGGYSKPSATWMYAARARITYALEDAVDDDVHLIRYTRLDAAAMARLQPRAILLSGNSSDPDDFAPGELDVICDILATTDLPIFGFCGGHQLIGRAFGRPMTRIGPADPPVNDDGSPAWIFEYGYDTVDLDPHPLFEGLGDTAVVRHAHGWQLDPQPDGFDVVARTALTPVQAMVHHTRPIFGTQFHPEWFTDEHPDGRTMIENFVRWAGLGR